MVIRTAKQFHWGKKEKYLLILNLDCIDTNIYHLLFTSKVEFYEKPSHIAELAKKNSILIEPDETEIFPLQTRLDCREVYSIARDELLERFHQGKMTFEGILPEEIIKRTDNKLRNSRVNYYRL